MAVSDIVNLFGMAPGRVVGGALDMISAGVAPVGDALSRVSMSPVGMAAARGAMGSSGGAPAVSDMAAMQSYAVEQQRQMYTQRQMQQELEQTFKGRPFNPNDRDSMYSFLQVFGKYFPERLPDAASKIHALYKQQALQFREGPGKSIYALDPMGVRAPEQVVAGGDQFKFMSGGKGSLYRTNELTGEAEQMFAPTASSGDGAKPTDVNAVRDQYGKAPKVVAYNEVMRNLALIEASVGDYLSGKRNPQAFNAVVTAFGKMLDPGSVVREAEFTNISRMQSSVDRILNAASLMAKGEVNDKLLQEIQAQSKLLGLAAADELSPIRDEFDRTAGYWSGQTGVPVEIFTNGLPDPRPDRDRLAAGSQGKRPPSIAGHTPPPGYEFTGELLPDGSYEVVPTGPGG